MYKLRIDLKTDTTLINTINYLQPICQKLAFVTEGACTENKHAHFYLETITKQPTIRSNMRKLVGSGNRSYSMGKLTPTDGYTYPIEYLSYMTKEGTVTYINFSEEEIDSINSYAEKIREDIKKKKKSTSVVDEIEKYILDFYPDTQTTWSCHPEIVRLTLSYYKESGKCIREFQIVSMVQTLLLKNDPAYQKQLSSRILEKINKI